MVDHTHPHREHGAGCDHGRVLVSETVDETSLVSVRRVSLKRGGTALLSNIDLDLHAGEIVTLIGPNGAGKTTLVKLILGIEASDSGTMFRKPDLHIGYVPQRFGVDHSMPMPVERFLTLGTGASRQAALTTLKDVGAARVIDLQLANLSGGEIQRVLIARALLRNPELLVLDEPARGVDYVGEAELYDLIGQIRDQRRLGVLLVSHDLHIVMAKSDRVICLNRHVCCSGKPETVARTSEYARLFGSRAASALAFYAHHHDHEHDLSGRERVNFEEERHS